MVNFLIKSILLNFYQINKIKLRFAPEPSGLIHIGHLKTIFINSFISTILFGKNNIRFDDTNPKSIRIRYYKLNLYDLNHLFNLKIVNITFSSFYVIRLYLFIKDLINLRFIKILYDDLYLNFYLIKKLRVGAFKEQEFFVSFNLNYYNSTCFFRLKYDFHFILKFSWCLYFMYDYSNSIVDRIELITHSICTKEFESHKFLYIYIIYLYNFIYGYKFLSKQLELSKCKIYLFKIGKRYINKIFKSRLINNYNDYRLFTLKSFLFKYLSIDILLKFIKNYGYTKSNINSELIYIEKLFRIHLNSLKFIYIDIFSTYSRVFLIYVFNSKPKEFYSLILKPLDSKSYDYMILKPLCLLSKFCQLYVNLYIKCEFTEFIFISFKFVFKVILIIFSLNVFSLNFYLLFQLNVRGKFLYNRNYGLFYIKSFVDKNLILISINSNKY